MIAHFCWLLLSVTCCVLWICQGFYLVAGVWGFVACLSIFNLLDEMK